MNWGFRITALYTGFVVMILTLVTLSMKQKVDLVTPDYYKEELAYQNKIEKIRHSKLLGEKLKYSVSPGKISIVFPNINSGNISGKILFYRPSDANQDQVIEINPDENYLQEIETKKFSRGVYRMEIDWKCNETAYFDEGMINIK